MKKIIEVNDFVKKYGTKNVVDHITFDVDEGSIFAFLGPNGAGKSTTINTLCTISSKTSGQLLIDGKDVTRQRNEVRSAIGVVFQEATLDGKMTVYENLRIHCHFYHIPKKEMDERIKFVLNLVDLADSKNSFVGTLSGGMKRRVEIARSLLHLPKVLFLDEPTTGLDPQTRAHIWEYIVKLQKKNNMTIFLSTHYMEEAEICDKVAVIDSGKIVAMNTPYYLKQEYASDRAMILSRDEHKLEELLLNSHLSFERKDDFFCVQVKNLDSILNVIREVKDSIIDLEINKGTLNDVFLEITGRNMRG